MSFEPYNLWVIGKEPRGVDDPTVLSRFEHAAHSCRLVLYSVRPSAPDPSGSRR